SRSLSQCRLAAIDRQLRPRRCRAPLLRRNDGRQLRAPVSRAVEDSGAAMCGIAGIAHWDGRPVERHVLKRMADVLIHRGPDEEGLYFNRDARAALQDHALEAPSRPAAGASVGLAHRRLSVIDLSSGQQPVSSEDGSVWIVFTGEIYNFQPLKQELVSRGHRFRTHSDTEVIVHAYEEWGEGCLSRLNG